MVLTTLSVVVSTTSTLLGSVPTTHEKPTRRCRSSLLIAFTGIPSFGAVSEFAVLSRPPAFCKAPGRSLDPTARGSYYPRRDRLRSEEASTEEATTDD